MFFWYLAGASYGIQAPNGTYRYSRYHRPRELAFFTSHEAAQPTRLFINEKNTEIFNQPTNRSGARSWMGDEGAGVVPRFSHVLFL